MHNFNTLLLCRNSILCYRNPGILFLLLSLQLSAGHERSRQDFSSSCPGRRLEKELSFVRGTAQRWTAGRGKYPIPSKYMILRQMPFAGRTQILTACKKSPCGSYRTRSALQKFYGQSARGSGWLPLMNFLLIPNSASSQIRYEQRGPIFKSKQTELVIGYQPDLVFTVFYSSADFKEKLRQARIPCFDLGYFGTIESIKDQILLMGRIIGEEGNAQALVNLMDARIAGAAGIKSPAETSPSGCSTMMKGGYVPGMSSNFTSICSIIGAVNVGAEQGIKSWSQIDYETLLKWNPDVIIVPGEKQTARTAHVKQGACLCPGR